MQETFPSDEQIKNAITKQKEQNPKFWYDYSFFTKADKKIISQNCNKNNQKIYILRIPVGNNISYWAMSEQGEPIGWTKFETSILSIKNNSAEISYHIFPNFANQGFGTLLTEESIKDFMETQPLNNKLSYTGQQLSIDSIEANINLDNLGSQALINKNGFVLESTTDGATKNYILTREMYFSRLNNNEQIM